jgi:predicted subunit of tRNA(5-methylaminomethyl-2-thiouridylate) methyltransferase
MIEFYEVHAWYDVIPVQQGERIRADVVGIDDYTEAEKRISELEEDNAKLSEHKRYYLDYINHHCGYDSITRLVSEHLKLKGGAE